MPKQKQPLSIAEIRAKAFVSPAEFALLIGRSRSWVYARIGRIFIVNRESGTMPIERNLQILETFNVESKISKAIAKEKKIA